MTTSVKSYVNPLGKVAFPNMTSPIGVVSNAKVYQKII